MNLSFACELYLKAIAEATKVNFGKTHRLDKLFEKLAKEDKKAIFDIWRENAGENITDCDYTRQMFSDNLEATANVFIRFRYADESAGGIVSLESSYTPEQYWNKRGKSIQYLFNAEKMPNYSLRKVLLYLYISWEKCSFAVNFTEKNVVLENKKTEKNV